MALGPKWVYWSASNATTCTPVKASAVPPNQRCMSSSQFGRGRRPRTLVESARPHKVAAARSAQATSPAARAMYQGRVPLMTRSCDTRSRRSRRCREGDRRGRRRCRATRRPGGRRRSPVRRRGSPRARSAASGVPWRSTALASTSAIHALPATTVTNARSDVGRSPGGGVDEVMAQLAPDPPSPAQGRRRRNGAPSQADAPDRSARGPG